MCTAVRVGCNRGVLVLPLRGPLVLGGGTSLDGRRRGLFFRDGHSRLPFAGPLLLTSLHATFIAGGVRNGGGLRHIPCSSYLLRIRGVIRVFRPWALRVVYR